MCTHEASPVLQSAAKLQPIERFSIKMQWQLATGNWHKAKTETETETDAEPKVKRPGKITRHCRRLRA